MAWQETARNTVIEAGATNVVSESMSTLKAGWQRVHFLDKNVISVFQIDSVDPELAKYTVTDTRRKKSVTRILDGNGNVKFQTIRGGTVIFEWVPGSGQQSVQL